MLTIFSQFFFFFSLLKLLSSRSDKSTIFLFFKTEKKSQILRVNIQENFIENFSKLAVHFISTGNF